MGSLGTLNVSKCILKLLDKADILTFSHTGYTFSDPIPKIPGFSHIICSNRPYKANSGGVAVYVRTSLNIDISLSQDLPMFGMAWVRIRSHRDVYLCICYLPPEGSTYFTNEAGTLDSNSHFETIMQYTSKYMALGEVIITGDLNSRTGLLDDRVPIDDLQEWQDLNIANVPIPSSLITSQLQLHTLPSRCSTDHTINVHGRRLIEICQSQGLVILNGRLPGDESGSMTYTQHGNSVLNHSSLIDYYISSASLAFDVSGVPLHHTHLSIPAISSLPPRPEGGCFDHSPVFLTLPMHYCYTQSKTKNKQNSVSYKWDPDLRDIYVDNLMNSRDTYLNFSAMYSASSVDDAATSFHKAIESSLLHLGKSVIRRSGSKSSVPCNSWYDDRCRAARKDWKEAVVTWGASSELANIAYHEYRRITRHIKRTWTRDNDINLAHDLYSNPKSFWQSFQRSSKHSDVHGLSDWTDYFAKLFSPGVESSDTILHSPDDIDALNLFPQPSDLLTSISSHLNNKFTMSEILTALDDALAGKAAGVDGIPVDFIKYAIQVNNKGAPDEYCIHILAGHITYLFNKILIDGYPSSWSTNALTPVPKPKGCPEFKDDYRGIAVSAGLAKLYSMVLLRRLD